MKEKKNILDGFTHGEVVDILEFEELFEKMYPKGTLTELIEFPFSEKYAGRGVIDIHDEITYWMCSGRLASEYNEGYYDALKFVLGMLNHNRKLEKEREHEPVVGDKYICYNVMSLVEHDNYYNDQYKEDKVYTIAMQIEDVVIFEGIGMTGIYVDDIKKFFRRVNE